MKIEAFSKVSVADRKRGLSQLSDETRKVMDALWLHAAREMGINVLDMSASEVAEAMKDLHARGFLTLVLEKDGDEIIGMRLVPTIPKGSGDL
jgi:hypothetical protein